MADQNDDSDKGIPGSVWIIRLVCIVCWIVLIVIGILGNILTVLVLKSGISRRCSGNINFGNDNHNNNDDGNVNIGGGDNKNNNNNNTNNRCTVTTTSATPSGAAGASTRVYLTALAVADITFLLLSLGGQLTDFLILFPDQLRRQHIVFCYSLNMLSFTATYASVWLLVAVNMDRMVWVVWPYKAHALCTPTVARKSVSTLVITSLLLNSHFIFSIKYSTPADTFASSTSPSSTSSNNASGEGNGTTTTIQNISSNISFVNIKVNYEAKCEWATKFSRLLLPLLDLTLASILPSFIILLSNVLIISKLHTVRQLRCNVLLYKSSNERRQTPVHNLLNKKDRRISSLTRMLLVTSLFFMLSTLPLLIYYFTKCFLDIDALSRSQLYGPLLFGVERLIYTIWYLNFSFHFLIYCLSAPRFRAQAVVLLCNWIYYITCGYSCCNHLFHYVICRCCRCCCFCCNNNNINSNDNKNNNNNNNEPSPALYLPSPQLPADDNNKKNVNINVSLIEHHHVRRSKWLNQTVPVPLGASEIFTSIRKSFSISPRL